MSAEFNIYLIRFYGTPNIEFNDTSGTVYGAKIDTILDSAPLSIRENIEEVLMSDIAVDTADGKFRPTTITLTGKIWHRTNAQAAVNAYVALRTLCFGITVPGDLKILWAGGAGSNVLGKVDHCLDSNWHPSDGMKQIEFEFVFTVLEAGL